jgi:hypothetical protein
LVVAVVLLTVAAAIVVAAVVVALGYGGELARFTADAPPWDPDIESAADVALLRPPTALLGYNVQATDDALGKIARAVTVRDVEIAALRRRLAELQGQAAAPDAPGGDPAGRQRLLEPAAGEQAAGRGAVGDSPPGDAG